MVMQYSKNRLMKQLIFFVLCGLVNVLISCRTKPYVAENKQQSDKDQEVTVTKHSDTATKQNLKRLEFKKGSIIDLQSDNWTLKDVPVGDEMISKCKEWRLSPSSIVTILRNGEAINTHDFSYLYYVLPCETNGTVEIDSSLYTYKINAGSFFILSNADTAYYFGCNSEKCRKFFLMPGGNPKRDLE